MKVVALYKSRDAADDVMGKVQCENWCEEWLMPVPRKWLSLLDIVTQQKRVDYVYIMAWRAYNFFFIGKNIPRGLIFLMDQMKKKLYNWEDIYRIWIWSLCDCWKTLYSGRNFHFDIIVNEFHQQLIKYPFSCLLILDIMSIESGRSTIEIRCMRLLVMFNCWERCRVEMKAGLGTSLRNVK